MPIRGFESQTLNIVMDARVEGLRAIRYLRWDFALVRRELEALTPQLVSAAHGMNIISDVTAVRLSEGLGLIGVGIAALLVGLPMLYNLIQRNQQRVRDEFAQSEEQILATAASYEIYEARARSAALAALDIPDPRLQPPPTLDVMDMQIAAMGAMPIELMEAQAEAIEGATRALTASREEWELYRWAAKASRGEITEISTAISELGIDATLAAQAAEYIPQILGAIAEEAANVNQALMGGADNLAIFFADTEQAMLDHQGDMETVQRRYNFVMEQLQEEGYTKALDLEAQKLSAQLSAMDVAGEEMERAAERRMGNILLREIDTLAKYSPQFAAAAWDMRKDVMLTYDMADEEQIRRAEQHMAAWQELYLQGPGGVAWQDILEGGFGALPTWEGGVVTLPELGVDTAVLDESVGLLTDEMLAYQKIFEEAGEGISIALEEAGGDMTLAFKNISADLALIQMAQREMFSAVFGAEVPWLPTIMQGAGAQQPPPQLPMIMQEPGAPVPEEWVSRPPPEFYQPQREEGISHLPPEQPVSEEWISRPPPEWYQQRQEAIPSVAAPFLGEVAGEQELGLWNQIMAGLEGLVSGFIPQQEEWVSRPPPEFYLREQEKQISTQPPPLQTAARATSPVTVTVQIENVYGVNKKTTEEVFKVAGEALQSAGVY